MPSPREDIEARMGLEPIEQLLAERAHLVAENAKGRARFAYGTWKFRRDRLQSLIAIEKRRELAEAGTKATEGIVGELVNTDARLKAFMDAVDDEIVAYEIAEDKIQGINDRKQRDTETSRYVAQELRMTP